MAKKVFASKALLVEFLKTIHDDKTVTGAADLKAAELNEYTSANAKSLTLDVVGDFKKNRDSKGGSIKCAKGSANVIVFCDEPIAESVEQVLVNEMPAGSWTQYNGSFYYCEIAEYKYDRPARVKTLLAAQRNTEEAKANLYKAQADAAAKSAAAQNANA